MLAPGRKRLFALACSLALGLVLAVFSYGAFASAAQATAYTPRGTAFCASSGGSAPAAYQGDTFMVAFDYFRVFGGGAAPQIIEVDITFPDGRIFTFSASQALDGVIDTPVNAPMGSLFSTNGAGQASVMMNVPGTWPYGCYKITGRGIGLVGVAQSTVHTGTTYVAVVPGGAPGPTGGPATLWITSLGVDVTSGPQGGIVEVDGRNFAGGELVSLWLTAPDGTVLNFPPEKAVVQATPGGAFSTSFQFEGKNPIGTYTFTALGQQSNARVFANYTLYAPTVTPSGPAQLRVVVPFDRGGPQRTVFYANGNLFWPGEMISLWLTLPDGAVRSFPITYADTIAGQFSVELSLDERLPVGFYQLTAQGVESRQLVIAAFTLEQAADTVNNPNPAPLIDTSSNPAIPPYIPPSEPNPADLSEYGNPDE